MRFLNQASFDDPMNRLRASGVDLNDAKAIVDPRGDVLAYAQTGGMIGPSRFELLPRAIVYRFGAESAGAARVARGGWWLESSAFQVLLSFAQVWDLSIGMAMRMLCLVPPEWSDATLIVRARVSDPLLAWRGLANSVVTPTKDGKSTVRMPAQNDISERRLHQLYIPGLPELSPYNPGLSVENAYALDIQQSRQGFLYFS